MREDTIEICHLKKAYGEHVIFSNLTMELKKGAVTCLMAPSGVGKTTLLRILAGLEQADGGKIGGLEALRKSMVFQEPRLAEELTAAANIQLAVKRRMFGKEKMTCRCAGSCQICCTTLAGLSKYSYGKCALIETMAR